MPLSSLVVEWLFSWEIHNGGCKSRCPSRRSSPCGSGGGCIRHMSDTTVTDSVDVSGRSSRHHSRHVQIAVENVHKVDESNTGRIGTS